eukprot:TRINITY_DN159_c1_g1_i1.p1 TRINITY_DN159_c1_g1~~TRINITY_DN159_c1_g1_i1.p1  ORF type:complete len:491 (+),score=145.54 TRINITY_DN159_c1_g1_i1:61-1533(+)
MSARDAAVARLAELFPEESVESVEASVRLSDGRLDMAVDHMLAKMMRAEEERNVAAVGNDFDILLERPAVVSQEELARRHGVTPLGRAGQGLMNAAAGVSRFFNKLTAPTGPEGSTPSAAPTPQVQPEPQAQPELQPTDLRPMDDDVDTSSSSSSDEEERVAPTCLPEPEAEASAGFGEASPSASSAQAETSHMKVVVTGKAQVGKSAVLNAMLGVPVVPTSLRGLNCTVKKTDPREGRAYTVRSGTSFARKELDEHTPVFQVKKALEGMVAQVLQMPEADARGVSIEGPVLLPAEIVLSEEQWPTQALSDPEAIVVVILNGMSDADVAEHVGKENVVFVTVKEGAAPAAAGSSILDIDPTAYLSHILLSAHRDVSSPYQGTFNEFKKRVWVAMGHPRDDAPAAPSATTSANDNGYTPVTTTAVPAVTQNPYVPARPVEAPHETAYVPVPSTPPQEGSYVPSASQYQPTAQYVPQASDYRPAVSEWQPRA